MAGLTCSVCSAQPLLSSSCARTLQHSRASLTHLIFTLLAVICMGEWAVICSVWPPTVVATGVWEPCWHCNCLGPLLARGSKLYMPAVQPAVSDLSGRLAVSCSVYVALNRTASTLYVASLQQPAGSDVYVRE